MDDRSGSGSAGADGPGDEPADLDFGAVAPAAAGGAAAGAATVATAAVASERAEKLEKVESNVRPVTAQAPAPAPVSAAAAPVSAAAASRTVPGEAVPAAAAQPARSPGETTAGQGAADTSPHGPVEITCHEERLDISTEWQVTYTARLRKYVTSETVERHVPVVRERVRVERVPVTEGERDALTQEEIAEAVEEVTLREERPVVRKYLVPIERVRLVVERYTDDHVVREELHREHVEIHDDSANAGQAAPGAPGASGTAAPAAPASTTAGPASGAPSSPAPGAATTAVTPPHLGQSRPEPLRSMG